MRLDQFVRELWDTVFLVEVAPRIGRLGVMAVHQAIGRGDQQQYTVDDVEKFIVQVESIDWLNLNNTRILIGLGLSGRLNLIPRVLNRRQIRGLLKSDEWYQRIIRKPDVYVARLCGLINHIEMEWPQHSWCVFDHDHFVWCGRCGSTVEDLYMAARLGHTHLTVQLCLAIGGHADYAIETALRHGRVVTAQKLSEIFQVQVDGVLLLIAATMSNRSVALAFALRDWRDSVVGVMFAIYHAVCFHTHDTLDLWGKHWCWPKSITIVDIVALFVCSVQYHNQYALEHHLIRRYTSLIEDSGFIVMLIAIGEFRVVDAVTKWSDNARKIVRHRRVVVAEQVVGGFWRHGIGLVDWRVLEWGIGDEGLECGWLALWLMMCNARAYTGNNIVGGRWYACETVCWIVGNAIDTCAIQADKTMMQWLVDTASAWVHLRLAYLIVTRLGGDTRHRLVPIGCLIERVEEISWHDNCVLHDNELVEWRERVFLLG